MAVGSRRMNVDFACNDPRNGLFAGSVEFCQFTGRGWDMTLEPRSWDGYSFTVEEPRLRFRLHRVWYPFTRSKDWFGNWCWNRYEMKRPQAIRLLKDMRDSGRWQCTEGPTRLYEWFNAQVTEAA